MISNRIYIDPLTVANKANSGRENFCITYTKDIDKLMIFSAKNTTEGNK